MSAQLPKNAGSSRVFVLDIDGRPTLAFEAPSLPEAQEICRDADLRADLMALTSDGTPVCMPNSVLVPRIAARGEITAFRHAVEQAPASDQPTMTFLITIDGVVVFIDPEQA